MALCQALRICAALNKTNSSCPYLAYNLVQWFANVSMPQNLLEGLLKPRLLGLTSRGSHLVGLLGGPGI